MQLVVGNLHSPNIVPNLLGTPVGQGIEFHQPIAGAGKQLIVLNDRNAVAGARALVFALPGNPGVDFQQLLAKRADFADAAALLMAILVETEQAFFAHQLANGLSVG